MYNLWYSFQRALRSIIRYMGGAAALRTGDSPAGPLSRPPGALASRIEDGEKHDNKQSNEELQRRRRKSLDF